MMPNPWLSAEQAAEYLAITKRALYEAIRRGSVPAYHFGRRLRFKRSELDQVVLRVDSPLLTEIRDVISFE